MKDIDVAFCFYDDLDYRTDADRDSLILRDWHRRLWTKSLPDGTGIQVSVDDEGYLSFGGPTGTIRVSSDTIATSHSGYSRSATSRLWAELSEPEQRQYERTFYTIGGFIVFPVRPQSLNQARGTRSSIADRFDLTLECIRQHYLGEDDNPLADVLRVDAEYFGMFGSGHAGFATFVDFFHLQDMVVGTSIRWLDRIERRRWDFDAAPLPTTAASYLTYLNSVAEFVVARNGRIRSWAESSPMERA